MPFTLQRRRPYFLDLKPKIQPVEALSSAQPEGPPRLALDEPVVLFDKLAIRDTTSHRPADMLSLRMGQKWAAVIDNDLDQAVTVTAIGSLENDPSGAPDIEVTGSVAANSREAIVADTWMPHWSVRLTAAATPTSGDVTVRGQVQVEA